MTATPFDILCPQHLCFDNDGVITHVGPGLRSVISTAADKPLFNLLTILRPLGISDLPTLFAHAGRALSVEIQGQDDLRLRSVVARHWDGGVLKPILWHCPAKRDQTLSPDVAGFCPNRSRPRNALSDRGQSGRDECVALSHQTFAGGKNVGRGTSAFRHIDGSAQSAILGTDIGSFGPN